MSNLSRHIDACTSAILPGRRIEFAIGTQGIGWVEPPLADFLSGIAGITLCAVALLPATSAPRVSAATAPPQQSRRAAD